MAASDRPRTSAAKWRRWRRWWPCWSASTSSDLKWRKRSGKQFLYKITMKGETWKTCRVMEHTINFPILKSCLNLTQRKKTQEKKYFPVLTSWTKIYGWQTKRLASQAYQPELTRVYLLKPSKWYKPVFFSPRAAQPKPKLSVNQNRRLDPRLFPPLVEKEVRPRDTERSDKA